MIEKLNPVAKVDPNDVRWLGHGAILVLYGAIVTGALLVRARGQRPSRPSLLDLAVIAAGILGVAALGDRVLRRPAVLPVGASEGVDGERLSHPAINVQRISFA